MDFIRKQVVEKALYPKRALLVYGPRRIGKTTLVTKYLETLVDKRVKYDVGDDLRLRQLFNSEDRNAILDYARPYDVLVIDEAQNIARIGLAAKMIVDAFPEKTLILTGSSSFDLAQRTGEPLTGRHFTMTLLPIAQVELELSAFERRQKLEDFLIFGSYPEVLLNDDRLFKIKILNELVSSYLFKDILALDRLKSPDLLLDITKCLAFQLGNEVSFSEIARTVHTDVKTVQRYVDLLEKTFIVKKVHAYSGNLRNEISKKTKFYFYDNGVRNAVISQFNGLNDRNDHVALWENFVFMEKLRKNNLEEKSAQLYFWRTKEGAEVDIVEEFNGKLTAIECKWSKTFSKHLAAFKKLYPTAETAVITTENFADFLL